MGEPSERQHSESGQPGVQLTYDNGEITVGNPSTSASWDLDFVSGGPGDLQDLNQFSEIVSQGFDTTYIFYTLNGSFGFEGFKAVFSYDNTLVASEAMDQLSKAEFSFDYPFDGADPGQLMTLAPIPEPGVLCFLVVGLPALAIFRNRGATA